MHRDELNNIRHAWVFHSEDYKDPCYIYEMNTTRTGGYFKAVWIPGEIKIGKTGKFQTLRGAKNACTRHLKKNSPNVKGMWRKLY